MPIASANPFPSMLYVEQGSTPASPSASQQRLFVRSSDHVLCMVNSSGTVTALSGSLTNPMSHAEALIKGGTAGAPTELVVGAAGGALSVINSAVAWNSGTSFPGSKATGDRYWRTDLGLEAYWDGTRWLTTNLFSVSFPLTEHLNSQGTTAVNLGRLPVPYKGTYSVWGDSFDWYLTTGGTYSGSVYWSLKMNWADVNDSDTQWGSTTLDTKLDTGGASHNYSHNGSIGAVLNASAVEIKARADPTGSPTQLSYTTVVLNYRLILT